MDIILFALKATAVFALIVIPLFEAMIWWFERDSRSKNDRT
jgi:hypothetical protein